MTARRITVDPKTIPHPRFRHLRVLLPEVVEEAREIETTRLDDAFVRAALRFARPGARILDVGTGTGAIPVKLALSRPDVTIAAIDLSEAMLRRARERVRLEHLSRRVRVRKGSARRIPYPRRAFDLVVSNSLLHHLPDPVPAFDEIARVLAPAGRVFIRDLRRPGPSRMKEHIRRHGRPYGGDALRHFSDSVRAAFKLAEIRDLIALSRLRGCRVRPQLATHLVIQGRPRRRG